MTLDDVREVWKQEGNGGAMSDHDVLTLVRQRSRALDRTLRWRDLREGIVGLVAAALLAPAMFRGPWLTRLGAIVVVVGCAIVVMMLLRARRSGPSYDDAPLTGAVRTEVAKVDAQIRLLETVLWWYIVPLSVGPALIVAGDRGASWFTAIYVVAAALLAWGIYALNQRAVRRGLRPRRLELQRLLDALEARGD